MIASISLRYFSLPVNQNDICYNNVMIYVTMMATSRMRLRAHV